MCVIAIAKAARPTEAQVRAMFAANSHGGGVAWVHKKKVHWEKGLEVDDMVDRCANLPFPFVAHFRLPSAGTSKKMEVCHPFPLEDGIATALKGSSNKSVLFHNGFWSDWKNNIITIAAAAGHPLPHGEWSDSRALAYVGHHCGWGSLDIIDEKVALLTATGYVYFTGEGKAGTKWTYAEGEGEEKGLIVSNQSWQSRVRGLLPEAHDPLPSTYRNRPTGGATEKSNGATTVLAQRGDTTATAPFWRGGSEEIKTVEQANEMLTELELWRSARYIETGPYRTTKNALKARLADLKREEVEAVSGAAV